jgi:hypothetical protein
MFILHAHTIRRSVCMNAREYIHALCIAPGALRNLHSARVVKLPLPGCAFMHAVMHSAMHSEMHAFRDASIHALLLRIYAFTHLRIYAFTHLRIYAFTHIRIYAYTHLCIYAFVHLCIRAFVHSCIGAPYLALVLGKRVHGWFAHCAVARHKVTSCIAHPRMRADMVMHARCIADDTLYSAHYILRIAMTRACVCFQATEVRMPGMHTIAQVSRIACRRPCTCTSTRAHAEQSSTEPRRAA